MKGFFVTGIDTGIGKTLACAVLVRAIRGNYWKPVQCGDLENTDTHTVKKLLGDFPCQYFPECFQLKAAKSPHRAAREEGLEISLNDFSWPVGSSPLVVEGAGGVLVPLNGRDYIVDLAAKFRLPAILLSRHYLGSLNHTLMAVEALQNRDIPIRGFIFNGIRDLESEKFLQTRTGLPMLLHMEQEEKLDSRCIPKYASLIDRSKLWI